MGKSLRAQARQLSSRHAEDSKNVTGSATGLSVEPDVEAMTGEHGLPSGHHRTVHRVLGVIADLPGAPPHSSTLRHAIAHVGRCRPTPLFLDVVPPLLRHLGIERDRAMRGDRRQMRPRSRHDVDELIASTAECHPPAAADFVCLVVD